MAKIITITGITGSGSKEFCKKYAEQGERVKVYHTADMIYEFAQRSGQPRIPYTNLINLHPSLLEDSIQRAFEEISQNLTKDSQEYERILIDTHAQFFWNKVLLHKQ